MALTLQQVLIGLLIGITSGTVGGVLGIGGGFILIPAMVFFLGFPQHVAEGTSLAVVIPTAVSGAIAYRRRGNVRFRLAALVGLGGVVGAIVGALVVVRIPDRPLKALFASVLLVIALLAFREPG